MNSKDGCQTNIDGGHLLLQVWSDLDRLLLHEFMCFPWQSKNPEVSAIWDSLTHPNNLRALEESARDVALFNNFAKECILRALSDCRLRVPNTDPRGE